MTGIAEVTYKAPLGRTHVVEGVADIDHVHDEAGGGIFWLWGAARDGGGPPLVAVVPAVNVLCVKIHWGPEKCGASSKPDDAGKTLLCQHKESHAGLHFAVAEDDAIYTWL